MNEQGKLAYFQRIVKPDGYAPREDALDIFLTDMKVHGQVANNPHSLIRNFARALKKDEPDRSFSKSIKVIEGKIEVGFDFDMAELLTCFRKSGKTTLRIYMPTAGLPMLAAKDALEKLKSINEKLFQKT